MKCRELRRATLVPILLVLPAARAAALAQTAPPTKGAFEIRFDAQAFETPFSGDLFVAFAPAEPGAGRGGEPREAMHGWFGAPPVMRFAVSNAAPGSTLMVDAGDAVAQHPLDWGTVEVKPWRVQAVARRSLDGPNAGLDEGDAYSPVFEITYDPTSSDAARLELSTLVRPRHFQETERLRLFDFVSPSLSKFHGRERHLRAGVLLPKDYGNEASYPVVYSITGFGGTYEDIRRFEQRSAPGSYLEHCIVVVPDATNRYGHSVFCDSQSIGPWGKALVEELIPALEAEYGGAGPEERYITGVSSGGWSSLWLQVTYPEAFAGCWSHCPDPIDFHDFQGIDLYEPLPDGTPRNMYFDEHGRPRGLARARTQVLITYEDFVRRENVLGPGGQIRSFEATFGPLGPDGAPRRVFDVATGAIDHAAAALWKPYDISDRLLTHWSELLPRLAGKVHIFAGEHDTFYLEGAVRRFQEAAKKQGLLADMQVEIVPGMAHELHRPGQEAMEKTILERHAARHPVPAGSSR
jgi:hypothetical protein